MPTITTADVYQTMFFAAIVLLAFSLPKLIIGLFWLKMNLWAYNNIKKFFVKKPWSIIFNKLKSADEIKKFANDKERIFSKKVKKINQFLKFAKTPIIEAIAALIFFIIVFPNISFDKNSSMIIIVFVIMLLAIIAYTLYTMAKIAWGPLRIKKLAKEVGKSFDK